MTPRQIADWDVGTLRARYAGFTDAVDAAPQWVRRGEGIAAGLGRPGAWEGVGSVAAEGDMADWVAVAARTASALGTLADELSGAVSGYGQAQDVASTALRTAAGTGVPVTPDGYVVPVPAVTGTMAADQSAALTARAAAAAAVQAQIDQAFELAARADALLESAVGVFTGLGIAGFTETSGFAGLASAVHVPLGAPVAPLPAVPVLADPAAVAAWWSALSLDVQLRLVREQPQQIGNLDGVSAWARDMANRIVLDLSVQVLTDQIAGGTLPPPVLMAAVNSLAMALAVRAALDQAAADGDPAQLVEFDLSGSGQAAIAVGDLDTADDLAVLVPGTGVDVTGDISAQVANAQALRAAAQTGGSGDEVAVLAWIGYDTPALYQAPSSLSAELAAPALATTLAGLSAVRPGNPPRTTVIGHSYGTAVVTEAAAEPGTLDADAVVLLGSPGTPADSATELEVGTDRVFVGDASADLVPHLYDIGIPVLGPDPSHEEFGAVCVTADMPEFGASDHHHYYDPASQALHNAALIVTGRYNEVQTRGCDD